MKKINIRRLLSSTFAISLFCFCAWYIFSTYEWMELLTVLATMQIRLFFVGTAITILVFWLLRALRWKLLLQSLGITISFRHIYISSALSMSIALLTPLMSGEILKIELLKREGIIDRAPGYTTFALEKALDSIILLLLGLVFLFVLFPAELPIKIIPLVLIAIIILCVLLVLLGKVLIAYLPSSKHLALFLEQIQTLLHHSFYFFSALSLTILSWAILALGWMICLLSISVDVSYPQASGLLGMITIVNIFSLIPAGIGISEASSAELLIQLGVEPPKAQAGAVMFRFYEAYILLIGGVHLAIWAFMQRKKIPFITRRLSDH